jgi:cyanate permease
MTCKPNAAANAIIAGVGIDHLKRGMQASPPSIMIGGMIQGILVAIAMVLIARQHSWAPRAAVLVGFWQRGDFRHAHVLPTFLPGYQDSFTTGPRVNVSWFSWLTAVAAIGAGLLLGYVGLRAGRNKQSANSGNQPPWGARQ